MLVSLVPMLEQKHTRNGKFFKLVSAQRCHRLGSEKLYLCGKMVDLYNSDKNEVIRGKKQTGDHC